MLLLKGTRTARIKTYQDHNHACTACRNFDLQVKVYKQYFHFFFVPIAATGVKSVKIKCNQCGQWFRSDKLNKEYEQKTRIPFYLYAGTIFVALLIVAGFSLSLFVQHEKSSFVEDPRVGDVYLIHRAPPALNSYYYIKIRGINGESVIAYHNNLQYLEFVSEFSKEDYFVRDEEVTFSKALLKEMLKNDLISTVERDYTDEKGFNRIR